LPCDAHIGLTLGGVSPFLGIEPVVNNLKRASLHPESKCSPQLTATLEMMEALSKSRGDHSYCLIRSLLRPSPEQIQSMNVAMGQALMTASKSCLGGEKNCTSLANPPLVKQTSGLGHGTVAFGGHDSTSSTRDTLASIKSGSVAVVALHLRLQEQISTTLDVNWGLYCAGMVAAQYASKANAGKGSPVGGDMWIYVYMMCKCA
jgi:hypothetical protein